jgi:pimeloyl-ACP methyl ester carboxylesterase
MTVVLVHGNPETPEVWDLLVDRLVDNGAGQPVRLAPPGFGAPVPVGFSCTPAAYRDWLIEELEAIPGPIDVVGHDWGGVHVVTAVMKRSDLVRSWASDALGVLAADYAWHPLARIWQAPGDGETWIRDQLHLTEDDRAAFYVSLGIDVRVARRIAPGFDATMGDAILRLYRAAVQPAMSQLGGSLDAAAASPGLAIVASRDETVGTAAQRRAAADRAGATVGRLDAGHWWMTEQDGRPGAELLRDFWAVRS